jgi:DNA replication protein DnaD
LPQKELNDSEFSRLKAVFRDQLKKGLDKRIFAKFRMFRVQKAIFILIPDIESLSKVLDSFTKKIDTEKETGRLKVLICDLK